MKLYEFQGKDLFRRYGIPVPDGLVCGRNDIAIRETPCVVKAQVLSGRRGKAGGVIPCSSQKEMDAALEKLFGTTLGGEPVNAALVEDRAEVLREYYLSVTFDGEAGTPLVIASPLGGVDVEEAAADSPEKILKLPFDSLAGPQDYHLGRAAAFTGTERTKEFKTLLAGLCRLCREKHALLAEINPLAETPGGLLALDAKVDLDDDAEPLDREFRKILRRQRAAIAGDDETRDGTITYVPLDGDIGLISDGAGTGMLTLDMIRDHGEKAADFCEMGGLTNPEVMYSAMETVARNPGLRSLLIVLIGGFNRMDEMALGITRWVRDRSPKIPVVVRLCGTMEAEGKEIMREAGLPVFDSLPQAVGAAVLGAAVPAGEGL
jgi:succinyl-CoA synthetase beta subunit